MALAVAAAPGAPAWAQMVRAQDVQSVATALRAAGYPADVGVDKIGDPTIRSALGGSAFQVFFYNCTDHRNCATVQFHAGYAVKDRVSVDRINSWNREQRFGRSYLDKDGDPVIEMDIDLDDGGVSQALFHDNLEFWAAVLPKFEAHIGYRR